MTVRSAVWAHLDVNEGRGVAQKMRKQDSEPTVTPVEQGYRRMFYDGDIQEDPTVQGAVYRPIRSYGRNRKISTFNVILSLFGLAVAVVFYISNIIAVSHLAAEINTLEERYHTVVNVNQLLRAELSRKSALERISRIASQELGLHHPREQPIWLEIDEELIEKIE